MRINGRQEKGGGLESGKGSGELYWTKKDTSSYENVFMFVKTEDSACMHAHVITRTHKSMGGYSNIKYMVKCMHAYQQVHTHTHTFELQL